MTNKINNQKILEERIRTYVVINTPTQENYNKLMEILEFSNHLASGDGWAWTNELPPKLHHNCWTQFEKQTCIQLESENYYNIKRIKRIDFGHKNFYLKNGFKIIPFQKFFQALPTFFAGELLYRV